MTNKEKFIDIYNACIKREGADKLLEWLTSPASDFFSAPASTRYHNAWEGGLCAHSLNVYECLRDYLNRDKVKKEFGLLYSPESIAIVALLHDLCKVNIYKVSTRNVKDEFGRWKTVPYYEFDDQLPYGHGEKSVYMISAYMKLTREEAFAIRYHMGFSEEGNARNVGAAFEKFPLALALSIADTEAAYYVETERD
ncbi:MAG: HD domain-containing protein [Clostridia bacterium]|nr:HD domain-containing protein [Clostridia bacterium]